MDTAKIRARFRFYRMRIGELEEELSRLQGDLEGYDYQYGREMEQARFDLQRGQVDADRRVRDAKSAQYSAERKVREMREQAERADFDRLLGR